MKKILVIGVLVLGGLWVCKKTNLCSYASTLWAKGQRAVKGQVPRQFEPEPSGTKQPGRRAIEIRHRDHELAP